LNVNSHHFGFGALNLDKLQKTPGDSRTTHLQPSNKFKMKIALKQRQIEEKTMENRLRKLQLDEDRLQR